MRRQPEEEKERPLNPTELKSRLRMIQDTVQKVESEVAAGTIPVEGMEDFKRAVDEARMRIWAVLTAAGDEDPTGFLERFRLRRAIEICRAVERDLADGSMRSWPKELSELRAVVNELGKTLGRSQGS
jgi:hypothetical protein